MAPSISRSCAVSRRMRATSLFSMDRIIKGKRREAQRGTGGSRRQKREAGSCHRTSGPARFQCGRLSGLGNVCGLRSLLSLHDFKLDRVALLKSAVPITHNGGVMHEDVTAILASDKSIPLGIIEPLHCSLHFLVPP